MLVSSANKLKLAALQQLTRSFTLEIGGDLLCKSVNMKLIAQYRKHTREQDKNLDKALHFILKARKICVK